MEVAEKLLNGIYWTKVVPYIEQGPRQVFQGFGIDIIEVLMDLNTDLNEFLMDHAKFF